MRLAGFWHPAFTAPLLYDDSDESKMVKGVNEGNMQ